MDGFAFRINLGEKKGEQADEFSFTFTFPAEKSYSEVSEK